MYFASVTVKLAKNSGNAKTTHFVSEIFIGKPSFPVVLLILSSPKFLPATKEKDRFIIK